MRKGLNNKGFTLVELLAVVVILALVMGIAASSMLSTMNSSRKSTLHSAAQTAATNINNWVADDMLITDDAQQKLGDTFIQKTQGANKDASGNPLGYGKDTWICLNNTILEINNKGASNKSLLNALGLNASDFIITGSVPANPYNSIGTGTCSALRYNSNTGGYEFFLNATSTGKYYVAADGADGNYAFSRAASTATPITD